MADIIRDTTDLELDLLLIQAFNAMEAELAWEAGEGIDEPAHNHEALIDRLVAKLRAAGPERQAAARERWGGMLPAVLQRCLD